MGTFIQSVITSLVLCDVFFLVILVYTGHQEDIWRLGSVTVAMANPYNLVFEAEVGTNDLGSMAIDDVDIIEDEKCPRAGEKLKQNSFTFIWYQFIVYIFFTFDLILEILEVVP